MNFTARKTTIGVCVDTTDTEHRTIARDMLGVDFPFSIAPNVGDDGATIHTDVERYALFKARFEASGAIINELWI